MMAMGKPWHPECFRCTVCVKPLTPETFKEYDGKPYCEKDYNNLFAPKCAGCKGPIVDVSKHFVLNYAAHMCDKFEFLKPARANMV